MGAVADKILEHLKPLLGFKLWRARRAADMRGFDFVQTESTQEAVGDEYCLDVQCPWRIEGAAGIITGRLDLWKPVEEREAIDWDTWDYQENENLQDRHLCTLLGVLVRRFSRGRLLRQRGGLSGWIRGCCC
jgi:hypothetical protein